MQVQKNSFLIFEYCFCALPLFLLAMRTNSLSMMRQYLSRKTLTFNWQFQNARIFTHRKEIISYICSPG